MDYNYSDNDDHDDDDLSTKPGKNENQGRDNSLYQSHQTVSRQAAAETDLTCRCPVSQQTSSVAASARHSHERTAGDQTSVPQAGSQPEIIRFNLVLGMWQSQLKSASVGYGCQI